MSRSAKILAAFEAKDVHAHWRQSPCAGGDRRRWCDRRAMVTPLSRDHSVVVLDRTGDVAVDLADPDDVQRADEIVLERDGRCDVLVHA